MDQYRQRKRRELDASSSPLIPTQQRRLVPEEELEEYLPDFDTDAPEPAIPQQTLPGGLSDREVAILTFERQPWRHAGTKEQAIRDNFQLSGTRYYQILNALLDNPAALEHDPVLVGRLRRLRGTRSRARRS